MAALAFGLVGSAVGGMFGMPSLGFSVGSALGGLLFPTKQPNTFGPQMGDMSVTSSAYGADIPYGFGTMRIAGNIIWASPVQEVVNTSKPGKGKGKGGKSSGGKTTVYTYYGNWAVAFAHGAATAVTRIWFDGVLVHDTTDTSGGTQTRVDSSGHAFTTGNSGGIDGSGLQTISGLNFRFYKGDEVQVADPLIEAWMAIGDISPAATKGKFKSGSTPSTPAGEPSKVKAGSQAVPGHRGLCYIVFENWCLTTSGNHIPMVTAEITFGVAPHYPFTLITPDTNPATNQGQSATVDDIGFGVDLLRGTAYRVSTSGDMSYVRRFDPVSMTEDLVKSVDDIVKTPVTTKTIGEITMFLDGFLYIIGPGNPTPGVHSQFLMKLDPNSLKEIARVDIASYFGLVVPDSSWTWGGVVGYDSDLKLHYWLVLGLALDGGMVIIQVDVDPLKPALDGAGARYEFFSPYSGTTGSHMWGCLPDPTTGSSVFTSNVAGAMGIALFGPSHVFAVHNPVELYSVDAQAPTVDLLATFTAGDLAVAADVVPTDYSGGMNMAHGMWADGSTAAILFGVQVLHSDGGLGDQLLVSYDVATKGLFWVLNLSASGISLPNSGSSIQSTILDHKLSWAVGSPITVTTIDTLSGTVESSDTWPASGADSASSGGQVYDGYLGAIIGDNGGVKVFANRHNPVDTTVGTIVRAFGERVGLQADTDLDTTELDDIKIKGYFVGQPTSARDAILPLAQAYLFDAVESDGVIKFPLRGKASVRDLTQAHDLAPVDQKTNLVVLETRAQEVDMPVYLAVSYYDGNNNYQQGTRIRRRSAVPIQNDPSGSQNVPTVHTQNIASLQWPIVLDAQTATRAADKYLFTTWLERTTFKEKLHWGHMDLDPSDVVTVQLTDGTKYTQRLTKLVLGGDLSIEADACSENSAVYSSVAQGGEDFKIVATRDGPSFTKLILLPTPLLADLATLGQEASALFYGASNYSTASFPGCAVDMSADLETWTEKDTDAYKMKWGTTGSILPDLLDPFSWDDDSTLVVFVKNGDVLENATDNELLDGQNALAVFNRDGDPEVIQFGTAVLNADGSYTVSHLLRGRRGTDPWAVNHGAGLTVVALDPTTIRSVSLAIDDLTQVRHYKGVGLGLTVDFADTVDLTSPGNDLKPYAPVHVAAGRPENMWDPDYNPDHYTVSTVNVADDHSANRGLGAGTTRTKLTIPPGKWYVEFPYAFGSNGSRWGFCDASVPSDGNFFIGFDAHSVKIIEALQFIVGHSRLCVAIDATADRAWWRLDDDAWNGAGGPADPVAGTNGIDLSGMTGPYYLAASMSFGSESVTIEGATTQQQQPPGGYIAGVPGSDIVLSWIRRTRMGGALHDATGLVPLNEGSEAYDVEIMTGPGTGVVARTYSGVTSPTVTYPAADALADWGTIPTTLTLRVYQLSAVSAVGRGFYVEQTVTVGVEP